MTDEQFAQVTDLLRQILDAVKQPTTVVNNAAQFAPRQTRDAVVEALNSAARDGTLEGSRFARALTGATR